MTMMMMMMMHAEILRLLNYPQQGPGRVAQASSRIEPI